jgi:hypothetical protein
LSAGPQRHSRSACAFGGLALEAFAPTGIIVSYGRSRASVPPRGNARYGGLGRLGR